MGLIKYMFNGVPLIITLGNIFVEIFDGETPAEKLGIYVMKGIEQFSQP